MTRNIPVSSPELYEAYKAWRDQDVEDQSDWADLKRAAGLCYWVGLRAGSIDADDAELGAQFEAAGLDVFYPFNHRGTGARSYSYENEIRMYTAHLNPMRIQWVNDRIADYEKEHGL